MEINLIGSTNNIRTKQEALEFGRNFGRICYSTKSFAEIIQEPNKDRLIDNTLKRGHHSIYEHVHFNFELKGIPKIGAMILNNENVYVTSEKSARFTQMETTGLQKKLYDKWLNIFEEEINKQYPERKFPRLYEISNLTQPPMITKLAQENARYITSVFTPSVMGHTLSFRQLNYIMHFFEEFQREAPNNKFNLEVKEFMKDFNEQLDYLYEPRLNPDDKKRSLNIFAKRSSFAEEFGENYSTSYNISFAGFAQEHRHRTLHYEMQPLIDGQAYNFFIPPILSTEKLKNEWIGDLEKLANTDFPQGILIDVHESGAYKDFISKENERLCGNAQLEIMLQTKETRDKYLSATKNTNPEVYAELLKYSRGAKCTFPNTVCTDPCVFTGKYGIKRLI